MIDIENIVFNMIANAVRTAFPSEYYPDLTVYGEYVEAPSGFPCVTIVETDNSSHSRSRTLDGNTEHYNDLSYEVNIYTNNEVKKSLAKSMADIVDSAMLAKNFRRTMRNQTPNVDRTIYRLTLRYVARVGEGVTTGSGSQEHTAYLVYKN